MEVNTMTHTTTKNIKNAYNQYKRSHTTELWQCYDRFSYNKERAMEYCKKLVAKYNGYTGKIIGHNCMVFSFGFVGEYDNRPAFFYITRDYDRYIYLDELED
jgi:hypothetical protein